MEYHEKRIKPFKSVTLYWHINQCEECRELFLAMNKASEIEVTPMAAHPVEGFTEAVMAKISALPASEHPTLPERSAAKTSVDWMRLAGCLYALLLAAGLGILYNTELIQLPYPSLGTWEWADVFLGSLAQTGQSAAVYTANAVGGFGNHVLAIAVVLGLTLVFMVHREKSFTKNYERYE